MSTLLILADDLTGALDTGVQIAQLQVNTQVRLYAGPDTLRSAEDAEVLVIDTESRHLPPEQAAAAFYRAPSEHIRRNKRLPTAIAPALPVY